MKQLKILLLTGIVTLFTTFTHAAPAVNMAPIISYLLSDTQKRSLLELIAGNTLYHHKGGTGDYLSSLTFNADATSVTITIIDGPNSGDSVVQVTSVIDDTLFIGDGSLILTEQTNDYLLFEVSRFYFDEAEARAYFPTTAPVITEAMVVGKTFYDRDTNENGDNIYATMTFTATEFTRHEIAYDSNYTETFNDSFTLPYVLIDGKIRIDLSLFEEGYMWWTLITESADTWYLAREKDQDQDGVIDVGSYKTDTWYLSKPIDFPIFTPAPASTLECEINSNYSPVDPFVYESSSSIATVIALHGKMSSPESFWINELAVDLNESEYDVILPYMPWSNSVFDASICESYNYISTLIKTEMAKGKEVILLGHSISGTAVSGYMALSEVTKPTATVILSPAQFLSPVLSPGIMTDEINRANELIANGNGDVYTDFLTEFSPGDTRTINTTPRIYLSYHTTSATIDMELFPNLNLTIPGIQTQTEVLWLAGIDDPVTGIAKGLGFIDLVNNEPNYEYAEIEGNHVSVMGNVADPLDVWYKN